MNITMNSAPLPVSGDAAGVAGAAPAEGLPLDPAQAAAQQGAQSPLAFLQFMQLGAAIPGEPLPELDAAVQAEVPDAAVQAAAQNQEEGSEAELEAAQPLLAAMSMPLTPAMMTMPAALPAALRLAAGAPERQERAADAVPAAAGAAAAGAVELPSVSAVRGEAAAQLAQAPESATAQLARAAAAVAQPTNQPTNQPTAAPQQLAAAAARDGGAGDGQPTANNGVAGADAGFGVAAPATSNAPARDGGTLTLSGPPTAWRQSLQEALGERLNLSVGKNAEQAVIRLEPPMLGRVEISIRHAAGSLEVNITATHSEVLRQLNTVSDNLRSDLAQRQYTDVSVNVSQATPRAQAGAQAGTFGADAQGRGRQQGEDQDERAPGAALAEANQSTTAFSLGGRA